MSKIVQKKKYCDLYIFPWVISNLQSMISHRHNEPTLKISCVISVVIIISVVMCVVISVVVVVVVMCVPDRYSGPCSIWTGLLSRRNMESSGTSSPVTLPSSSPTTILMWGSLLPHVTASGVVVVGGGVRGCGVASRGGAGVGWSVGSDRVCVSSCATGEGLRRRRRMRGRRVIVWRTLPLWHWTKRERGDNVRLYTYSLFTMSRPSTWDSTTGLGQYVHTTLQWKHYTP